jgi:hypothetical protein
MPLLELFCSFVRPNCRKNYSWACSLYSEEVHFAWTSTFLVWDRAVRTTLKDFKSCSDWTVLTCKSK